MKLSKGSNCNLRDFVHKEFTLHFEQQRILVIFLYNIFQIIFKLQNPDDIMNPQNRTKYTPADDVLLGLDF